MSAVSLLRPAVDLSLSRDKSEDTVAISTIRFKSPIPPHDERGTGLERVQVYDDGTFKFDPEGGRELVTAAVFDELEEAVGMVAWEPAEPAAWWFLTGAEELLGWRWLRHRQFAKEPVVLYPTPQDWFEAQGRGCVILDWRCDPRGIFLGVTKVHCTVKPLADRLRARLAELERPHFDITVG